MAWIESHQSLLNHPKTRKLSRTLGIQRVYVVGHLHCLWWWCMEYADDGLLGRFDNDVIADACEWLGDPDEFVNALCEAGFLDRLGPGYAVHDWDDYAGKLIQKRRANTERMRVARAAHNEPPSNKEEPRATHVQRTDHAHTHTCEATVPNLTVPNQTKPDSTEPKKTTRSREPVATATVQPIAVFFDGCAVLGVDPSEITGAARDKQCRAIKDALKASTPDDVLGCLRWLLTDDWKRERGVDFLTVRDNLSKWLLAGKPSSVAPKANGRASPTPKVTPDFSGIQAVTAAWKRSEQSA